eukprot:3413659-Pleurochrysis_carterae.AAC.1
MCCWTRPSAACIAAARDTKVMPIALCRRATPLMRVSILSTLYRRPAVSRPVETKYMKPPSASATSRWCSSGTAPLFAAWLMRSGGVRTSSHHSFHLR